MGVARKVLLASALCFQTLGHQLPEQAADVSKAEAGDTKILRRLRAQQQRLPEEAPGVSKAEEGDAETSRRLQAQQKRMFRLVRIVTGVSGVGSDADDGVGQNVGLRLWLNLLGNLVWCVLQFAVAACIYNSIKDDRLTSWSTQSGFDGLFNCGADSNCLCGCCCGLIRTAQTQHAAGLRQFWPTLLILILCYMLPSLVGYIALSLVRLCFRTSLRTAAGLDPDGCNDCLVVFCCCPCSVCQEARLVDNALKGQAQPGNSTITTVGQPVVVMS